MHAREPVACTTNHGLDGKADVFCRECAINDLVTQRIEIKRLETEAQRDRRDEEINRLDREEEDQQKEVARFERGQSGLDETIGPSEQRGLKRKAEQDNDSLERGRQKIGQTSSSAGTNGAGSEASFWVPGVDMSKTTNSASSSSKPIKLNPLCPASTPTSKHNYSLKSLQPVNFTLSQDQNTTTASNDINSNDTDDTDPASQPGKMIVCPSCQKSLTNSSRAMLAKPCGHVICGRCVDTFMRPKGDAGSNPASQELSGAGGESREHGVLCYVCETDLTPKLAEATKIRDKAKKDKDKEKVHIQPGLIEISCEGTGFAAAQGGNVAKKDGVAFQFG